MGRPHVVLAVALTMVAVAITPAGALLKPRTSVRRRQTVVRLSGHVLPAVARAAKVTATAPELRTKADEPITLTLVLNRDDQEGFERYLHEVYDPHAPDFRRFLTQREIADRFGPSRKTYDTVVRFLEKNGFRPLEGSSNRMTITVRGTRGMAENAFDVRIDDYRMAATTFSANDRDPALPNEIASSVRAIQGLTSLARPKPTIEAVLKPIANAICPDNAISYGENVRLEELLACPVSPFDAYDACKAKAACDGVSAARRVFYQCFSSFMVDPPAGALNSLLYALEQACNEGKSAERVSAAGPAATIDGTGQTIGLVEFDSFDPNDVADYLALLGLPSTLVDNVNKVDVNGGTPPGPNQDEVLLDINAILTVARGARVVVYDAPFVGAGSFQPVLNRMISDGVDVISNSWAYCEDQTTAADVDSIDTLFQQAAASGISVLNAAGDTGTTCLDGAVNTLSVPADSPNATAVGGSALTLGPGGTYASEAFWDGSNATPPTGRGGFGVSTFFGRPAYQNGLTGSPMRSVPDVVLNADPARGVVICQSSGGGCPTGLLYNGTSNAAPTWAAFAAQLNQAIGHDLGALNPLFYPLAGTPAFHGPAALGSDFAHVGLGSPDVDRIFLALSGQTVGAPSASLSAVGPAPLGPGVRAFIPADGVTGVSIVVKLVDANRHSISGKTIALAADNGTGADVSPPTTITDFNGTAIFTVTDATIEDVTLTATDTTDGVPLSQTAAVSFVPPPATSGGVDALPTIVAADGVSASTITVTLHDAQGDGALGKIVTLAQGSGRAQITGPSPATTDTNGQVTFTATDLFTEIVTFSAVDVSDGDLPVPVTAQVSFTNGSGSSCNLGQEVPQSGWSVTSPITGFALANNCVGVSGTAWDPAGNLWAMNYPNGKLYRFRPAGGIANTGTLVGTVPNAIPPTGGPSCPHGLTFSKDGQHLYLARQFCGSGGDVVEISTADGSIVRNLTPVDAIHCATGIATDPLSGDLFVTSPCQNGDDVFRIANPDSGSPQLSVYASPGRAIGLNFTPDGTIWTEAYPNGTNQHLLVKISGTNSAHPGTVTQLSTDAPQFAGGVLPALNAADPGSPPFLFVSNGTTAGATGSVVKVDLTKAPPVITTVATGSIGAIFLSAGPDGCAYVSNGDRIDRITAADGTCSFATSAAGPSLSLSPASALLNAAQGISQTFTATVGNGNVPPGTPVFFQITGANTQLQMVRADANGQATFSYGGTLEGTDTIVASTTLDGALLTSNQTRVVWNAGKHTTFLSLNPSPRAGKRDQAVTVVAALTDMSAAAPVAVVGESVHFTLGGAQCDAVTDANGQAGCDLTPTHGGIGTLTAAFAGTNGLLPSNAAVGLDVVTTALGHFVSYATKPTKGTAKFLKLGAVTLTDEFGGGDYDVLKPTALGVPANKNGEGFTDQTTHLEAYAIKPAKGSAKFAARVDLHIANQCSDLVVTAAKPVSLLVPTAEDPNAPVSPPDENLENVDHFLCYRAKTQKKRSNGTAVATFAKGVQVDVTDEFATRRYDLTSVALLCNPVAKSGTPIVLAGPTKGAAVPITPADIRNPDSHLVCYTAKIAKKHIDQRGCGAANPSDKGTPIAPAQPRPVAHLGLHVANQVASGEVDAKKPTLLCIPTARVP